MMAINPDIDCGRCPRFCARFVEWPAHFRFHVITTQGRAGIVPNRSAAVDIVRVATEDELHPMPVVLPPFTSHFASLARGYDVALCDVWGVVHNGVAATAEACDALACFRNQGGTVVLITNAPRPGEIVARTTLERLGVPHAAYDGIVSSGDVTRAPARGCFISARSGIWGCSRSSMRRSRQWRTPIMRSARDSSTIRWRRRRITRVSSRECARALSR